MRTKNILTNLMAMLAILLGMGSCDIVHDDNVCDQPETVYQVRFRYDMNMKYADAFAHEVHAVTLLVLDQNGALVWRGHESGSALAEEGYAMTVPVNPGNYQLLAWCTTNEQDTYTLDTSGRAIDGYICTLNHADHRSDASKRDADPDDEYYVDHDLDPLYHGLVSDASFPDEPGTHTVLVPLTKDTNRIRVVLQHISGAPMDEELFSFDIKDDNAVLNYDNTVIAGNPITYEPWHTAAATTEDITATADGTSDASTTVNVLVAELTVNRLVTMNNPRLIVTNNETGDVVFNIPVKDYALMVKGYENSEMDDQEYLDRQDEYNMTFFLDERNNWFSAFIYINSWRIVLSHTQI